ncbi:hypothetical protein V8E54_007513 [Elaphomyces granulatus]
MEISHNASDSTTGFGDVFQSCLFNQTSKLMESFGFYGADGSPHDTNIIRYQKCKVINPILSRLSSESARNISALYITTEPSHEKGGIFPSPGGADVDDACRNRYYTVHGIWLDYLNATSPPRASLLI